MTETIKMVPKEISWLSFNERVLQEAMDKSVPIIERVRFLGIFSSNFDEFYKVRFADVKRRIIIDEAHGRDRGAKKLQMTIQEKADKLQTKFDEVYKEVMIDLARRNIFLVNEEQLDDYQTKWLKNYFIKSILPFISPILLNNDINLLDFLQDEYSYLAVSMSRKKETTYALIEIPTENVPRFIVLPEKKGKRRKTLILLDNIIHLFLNEIFSAHFNYDQIECYSMKMTRDAEYDLGNEVEQSLLENMSMSLKQRLTALPVRFTYEQDMPKKMFNYIKKLLKISDLDSISKVGRYQNFKDFLGFPNVGPVYLENSSLPPLRSYDFDKYDSSFEAIKANDILLYYPYYSFNHITEWVRQASYDPKVRSIKINIYRVAKNSRIIKAMIDAANNGKEVTVIVELQARFDEKANIKWAHRLTNAGVKVLFGVPGLKIHSKLCLISRREGDEIVRYAHLGTGNFNEKTAHIYTDFALLTANQELAMEVRKVFTYIENPYRPVEFQHLLVSPNNARLSIVSMIEREIKHAKAGKKAAMTVKVNNLVDTQLIKLLYSASQAGVKIRMIIRGMCALVPGVKGISENIHIISIVDRFLEHPRVFIFENNGKKDTFISSADWMTRNLDNRIEVGCPVYDPVLKKRIQSLLELQFKDRVKARIIDEAMSNQYVPRGNKKKVRSQIAIYDFLKKVEKEKLKPTNK